MARDNREILRAVRVGDALFKAGQEDELAEKLTASRLSELSENGTLTGDWGATNATTTNAPKADVKTDAKADSKAK